MLQHIDSRVQHYFAPWLDYTGGVFSVLKDTAGAAEPYMARQHFLFQTATDMLCFCHLNTHLLERPGSNVFTVIGLQPAAAQLLELKHRYANARTVGVFDDDLCGRVLDCKVALWQMRRDASFALHKGAVTVVYRNEVFNMPVPQLSLHRFRTLTGMRSTYRTIKPNGAVSFTALLAGNQTAETK